MWNRPAPSPADGVAADLQTDDANRDIPISPAPFDCSDLAETFRTDMAAAFHLLMTLTSTQLNLQALAYAAHLNQLHGLSLDMDDILAGWQYHIEHQRRTA